MNKVKVSVIILTYSRPQELIKNVSQLLKISYDNLEIIVIDNCSKIPARTIIESDRVKVIRCEENLGVGGRNIGIRESSGEIIFTLDDDVFGLSDESIICAIDHFSRNRKLSAINFKILDEKNRDQINWIHHRKIEEYRDVKFETYEISEGAVVFKREYLAKTDLYPSDFFISHEGPDLALQLLKIGGEIIYEPLIIVYHAHSEVSRESWRRYYYDTRNQVWLAIRHYPLSMALRKLFVGLSSLMAYSIRDGYTKYYLRALKDAAIGSKKLIKTRDPIKGEALRRYKDLEKMNAPLSYMVRKRIRAKKIRI